MYSIDGNGEKLRKKYEVPLEDMYKDIDDSGRGERVCKDNKYKFLKANVKLR